VLVFGLRETFLLPLYYGAVALRCFAAGVSTTTAH